MGMIAFFSLQIAYSQACPDVSEIKLNHLIGWKLLDSDDDKLLSDKRQTTFRKDVDAFAMAEWSTDQTGKIRCFYRDKNGSSLEAYLTKDHFVLTQANQYWYDVSGAKECAAGSNKCGFQNAVVPNSHLAGKTLNDHLEDLIQKYWR